MVNPSVPSKHMSLIVFIEPHEHAANSLYIKKRDAEIIPSLNVLVSSSVPSPDTTRRVMPVQCIRRASPAASVVFCRADPQSKSKVALQV